MKPYLILILVLIFSFSVFGQKLKSKPIIISPKVERAPSPDINIDYKNAIVPCNLDSSALQPIRGLAINMSYIKTLEVIPNLKRSETDFLPKYLTEYYMDYPRNPDFNGVRRATLTFFNSKLVKFELLYIPAVEWNSISEYRNQLSQTLKLPLASWSTSADKRGYGFSNIKCKDFEINATFLNTASLPYSMSVERRGYFVEAIAEEQRDKENKKKEFKP